MPSSDIAASADLMEALTEVGIAAAAAILQYRQDGAFRIKADGSPVTPADEAAEAIIREALWRAVPDCPIVSEEQAERERPKIGANYFLVDPLDGTREFIAGRDEYTVNIGLVCGGKPALGIVVAPALGLIWRGSISRRAERLHLASSKAGPPQAIRARQRPDGELIVMVSRSHLDPPTQAYVDALPHSRLMACGSSIKFCRLAEGAADLYPRLGPTRDWDVAAGHAVLAAAGGSVMGPDGSRLAYGTADLRIPAFVAWGAPPPDRR